jgi:hypothetical protein
VEDAKQYIIKICAQHILVHLLCLWQALLLEGDWPHAISTSTTVKTDISVVVSDSSDFESWSFCLFLRTERRAAPRGDGGAEYDDDMDD